DVVVRIRPEVVVGVRPENVIEEVVIGVRPEQRPEPADHDAAAPPGPERATEPAVESGPSEVRLPRPVADGTLTEDCVCARRGVAAGDDVAGASKAARVQGTHRGRSTPATARPWVATPWVAPPATRPPNERTAMPPPRLMWALLIERPANPPPR